MDVPVLLEGVLRVQSLELEPTLSQQVPVHVLYSKLHCLLQARVRLYQYSWSTFISAHFPAGYHRGGQVVGGAQIHPIC